MRRRHPLLLLGLLMSALLLAPSAEVMASPVLSAALLGNTGSTITVPKVRMPAYVDPEEARQEMLEGLWNARGSIRATLGGRDLFSIQSQVTPGARLIINDETGIIRVESGTDMFTEGETSIRLVISRGDSGWLLTRGRVRVDGKDFFVHEGEITIHELDAARGILRASFSFLGRSDDQRASQLRVTNGTLSIRRQG